MSLTWLRIGMGFIAALAPAVVGAVVFAHTLGVGQDLRLLVALVIGILCGGVLLFVSRLRDLRVLVVAATAAVLGVAVGFLFDAKWNADRILAPQLAESVRFLMENQGLDAVTARIVAKTQLGGQTMLDLVRIRLDLIGWLTPLFAIFGAVLAVRSRFVAGLLRMPPSEET